jgi:hypothetical protein
LHYDVADAVRYYAELEVERGENHLRPDWLESRLPTLYRYVGLGEERADASREGGYVIYDRDGARVEHGAAIAIAVEVSPGLDSPDTAVSRLSWSLTVDGSEVASDTRSYVNPVEGGAPRVDEVEIYADDYHRYWVRVRLVGAYAHLELNGAFLPYSDGTDGS